MTVSPSGSLFVAVAVSVSFVFGGVAGAELSTVAVGTRSHVTVLSVDVEAVFELRGRVLRGAGRDRRDDLAARRHPGDRDVVDRRAAGHRVRPVFVPPVPRAAVNVTSLLVKPVTGSLNVRREVDRRGRRRIGLAGSLVDRHGRRRSVDLADRVVAEPLSRGEPIAVGLVVRRVGNRPARRGDPVR